MLPLVPDVPLQKLPSSLVAGARVRARGATWRIHQVQPFASCAAVHLIGADPTNAGERRTLLHPFDRLQPDRREPVLRVVRRRRWCHAFRRLLASHHPHDGLRAAAAARVELLPYQLEPALAAVRGLACRLLLADEVGLGKTIQAGLLLAELRERGLADRALILTPAGLRRQWQAELRDRFAIDAALVDRATLRTRASALPVCVNPWLVDEVAIASVDLIKRPEAMRGLSTVSWDLLIIDEAHIASPASRRHAAADALARRSRRVVLLTATPHAGDAGAFAALCRLGQLDGDRLAMFRRSRSQVAFGGRRRVRTLSVRLRRSEAEMHRLLAGYTRRVVESGEARDATLAMAVLTKRALSGPVPLRLSVERRLDLLAHADAAHGEFQLTLPLAGEDDELDDRDVPSPSVLAAPGLADRAHELALLGELAAAARAVPVGGKVRALVRLLRRIREPAIVFTEYRDTLHHLAAVLSTTTALTVIHGGLKETERRQALQVFASRPRGVLLATDAAGEGLNLQAHARLVINLELPWNPMRLEQRIGRVDRLGQTRTVHAINLLARDTAETTVAALLVRRLARARRAIGVVNDPLGLDTTLARMIAAADPPAPEPGPAVPWQPDLRGAAASEAGRLGALRSVTRRGPGVPGVHVDAVKALRTIDAIDIMIALEQDATLVTTLPGLEGALPGPGASAVWLMCASLLDANGQLVEEIVVPVAGPLPAVGTTAEAARRTARQLLGRAGPALQARVTAVVAARQRAIRDTHRLAVQSSRLRELALLRATAGLDREEALVQAGLFERRALRDRETRLAIQTHTRAAETVRLFRIEAAGHLAAADGCRAALMVIVAGRARRRC